MTSCNYVPDRIKIYPLLGVRANALHARLGGSWRFWVICQLLDKDGSGFVEISVVNSYLQKHGVKPQQVIKWMNDACKSGFVEKKTRRTGVVILLHFSPAKVAVKLGCTKVDARTVEMDISQILGENWRSELWMAYLRANHNEKIISRERLQEITGVERHQQLRFEKDRNIRTIRNVAITNRGAWQVGRMRKFEGKVAYSFEGKAVFRLPDTRIIDDPYVLRKGQSTHINKKIESLIEDLAKEHGPFSQDKLFHSDQMAAEKHYANNSADDPKRRHETFYFAPDQDGYEGGQRWQVVEE